jgi:hypothetical protein
MILKCETFREDEGLRENEEDLWGGFGRMKTT